MADSSKTSSITSQYLDSEQVFLNLSLTDNAAVVARIMEEEVWNKRPLHSAHSKRYH